MSLIGMLTATEKQVYLGQLLMRPIQWHLKNHWGIPDSLEKVGSNRQKSFKVSLFTHSAMLFKSFTDPSREGWGTHLGDLMARGTWSLPESKLHINYLELKVVCLALKEFQDLCSKKIVLIATDNTTVVAYITRKEA